MSEIKKVRCVSLDLWQTLIKSGTGFREASIKYWSELLGTSPEQTTSILKSMKNYFTDLDEITGRHSTLEERIFFMYSLSNKKISKEELTVQVDIIYPKLEELFLANLPVLYDDTLEVLTTLKEKGIQTNILSNTGIIMGKTLEKALIQLGISDLITYKIWSDEYKLAKPSKAMFNLVMFHPANKLVDLQMNEILHVGDNTCADGGCVANGMQFLQINSNENTIKKVLEYV